MWHVQGAPVACLQLGAFRQGSRGEGGSPGMGGMRDFGGTWSWEFLQNFSGVHQSAKVIDSLPGARARRQAKCHAARISSRSP